MNKVKQKGLGMCRPKFVALRCQECQEPVAVVRRKRGRAAAIVCASCRRGLTARAVQAAIQEALGR